MVWPKLIGNSQAPREPIKDNNYRAAEYSMQIDFSSVVEFMPEFANMIPSSRISHLYYIQYGKNTLIEIRDPGNAKWVNIVKWDYAKKEFSYTFLFDNVRKYYTSIDTISFSIDECKGITKNLCDNDAVYEKCDSVNFVSQTTNTHYYVHFNDTISNLPSHELLYPDIKYLPSKIIRVGKSKNTIRNLEQVIYGKESVDFLINLYDYKDYGQISDEEWNQRDPQLEEVIEKFIKFERNKE